MKTLPFILLALAMLALAGCNGTTVALGASALGIIKTKPKTPPPADTDSQIAAHQSWCYGTLGDPDCYPYPIKGGGPRLINVEPQNYYPLTPRAYDELAFQAGDN